jgi:phage-related tail protein
MEIDYKVVVEELIRLFESDAGEFPILHTAIRCLNQQAQEIDTLRAMLKTLEENYTQLAEFSEHKIDANYNLRILHSAMVDGIKVLYKELINETDALDMKLYVDMIYNRLMDKYSDGIGDIINYETLDR